jgi:hypothetical protein
VKEMGLMYSGNVTRFEDGLGSIDTHDKAIGMLGGISYHLENGK